MRRTKNIPMGARWRIDAQLRRIAQWVNNELTLIIYRDFMLGPFHQILSGGNMKFKLPEQ